MIGFSKHSSAMICLVALFIMIMPSSCRSCFPRPPPPPSPLLPPPPPPPSPLLLQSPPPPLSSSPPPPLPSSPPPPSLPSSPPPPLPSSPPPPLLLSPPPPSPSPLPPPPEDDPLEIQNYLDSHNTARAEVGVGPMEWNNAVYTYAQGYANQRKSDCLLQHSETSYGENLFWGMGKEFTAVDAVKAWVDEKQWYHYEDNSCDSGKMCGHYTQVVWSNSVELGCARVQCANGAYFITCNYNPPGNYVNQKPY
ncbi:Cysteine-rich secretory protein [Zostera marina]|uniref:Cysteine-rich secretory protein n=1 Tax=Zostera marina TaxID=29655 RepID=A0A0K9PYI9_ZOSMR|nr:Cysteine-rich secretory protein [Zostera marina]